MALTLIGSWHVEAWGSRLLQGTLLGEVPRLATSIAASSLATSVGIGRVAVTTGVIPASSTVGVELAVGVVGPGGLRSKPLRGWCRLGWGQAAGPLTARSILVHHSPLAALTGSLVLVLNHYGSIHHGFQVRIRHIHQVGLQLLIVMRMTSRVGQGQSHLPANVPGISTTLSQ
jgi:hypothetical protein